MLSAVARRIERDWDAHLARWDLNHASLPVLAMLAGGPRSQRELAAGMDVTEQTMSRVVARLERTGYVVRRPSLQDRRRHEVALTATGRAVLGEAGDPDVAEELGVRGLPPQDVAELRRILGRMLAEDGLSPGDAE